jgi:ABC-type transport system involved in multi-copper enzyme maturation permease subunit
MSDLVNVTRAELAKLVRRPAAWVLLAAAITLDQVFGFVIPYLSYKNGSGGGMTDGESPAQLLAGTLPAQVITNTTAAFPVFVGALALVLGALVTGNEFTGGTLKTLLTQGPRRTSVFGGQLLALLTAVGVGVLTLFLAGAAFLGLAIAPIASPAAEAFHIRIADFWWLFAGLSVVSFGAAAAVAARATAFLSNDD